MHQIDPMRRERATVVGSVRSGYISISFALINSGHTIWDCGSVFSAKMGTTPCSVLPNGPIFSDFGPESDFFEQNGPELVWINTQKSGLGGNKQRQINNVLYLRDIDRS